MFRTNFCELNGGKITDDRGLIWIHILATGRRIILGKTLGSHKIELFAVLKIPTLCENAKDFISKARMKLLIIDSYLAKTLNNRENVVRFDS